MTGGLAADPTTLLALIAGAVSGGGLLLFVIAIRGVRPRTGKPAGRSREELIRTLTTRTALAIIAGVIVLVVTRWPVAASGAPARPWRWRPGPRSWAAAAPWR